MNRRERRRQAKEARGAGKGGKAASHGFRGEQLAGMGKIDEAIMAFKKAISIDPQYADAHYNLGVLLRRQGQLDEAIESYLQATAIQPDYAEAHYNLGNALRELGRQEEALASYHKALVIRPDFAEVHNNLGQALNELGRQEEALASYHKALAIRPDYAEANNNLGSVLQKLGRQEEALASYHKALAIRPDYAEVHTSLGVALKELGRQEEALASHHMALAINPDYADAHNNLGSVLQKLGRQEEALASYHKALVIRPNFAEAHNNLGGVFKDTGRFEEALKSCRRAVELKPDYGEAHANLALALLQLGHLKEGWEEYEWRWGSSAHNSPARTFPQPLWDGSSLEGKHIFLWGEQGIADEIRFASMIPDLPEAWGDEAVAIDIECDGRLVDLFTRSFEGITAHPTPYEAAEKGKAEYDFHCPTGSLGRFLRPTLDSFRRDSGAYLVADPERRSFWQKRLAELSPSPKVGLAWRSGLVTEERKFSYATIKDLAPVLTLPGVDFINLLYDECEEELAEASELYGIDIHTWDDLDLKDDQDGVASLIAGLDLVVCYAGAAAELAGALGVPGFVFHGVGVYFWLGTGTDVWHPNTQCFGKEMHAAWEPTFEDIAQVMRRKFGLDA